MKKVIFLFLLAIFSFRSPALVKAAPVDLGSLFDGFTLPSPPPLPIFGCAVVGSIKNVANVNNEVTYKISYGSNYTKLNAPYNVVGTVEKSTANITVYRGGGATSFGEGDGYLMLQGNQEAKFSYPIKSNPGVVVSATVDGVKCTSKYFETVQPVITPLPKTPMPDLTISTSSLSVTTSIPLNPVQAHTCKVLIEAAPIDNDSILIGGVISAQNLKKGQYDYSVRGYRNDEPNNVTKYDGLYNAKVETQNTFVFGQGGKAFLFTYDSKDKTDAYVITATLGNIDCSAVFFPSHLQDRGSNGETVSSSESNESGGQGNVTPQTTVNNDVIVVGLSDEERNQGEKLNLLEKTGSEEAKTGQKNNEKATEDTIFSNTQLSDWSSKDYVLVGLLGAIFISLLGYGIMKYRGLV